MLLIRFPAAGLLFIAAPALAHSPYLLPNQFDVTQRDHVSVQASFTEQFFVPDVVMKAADYHVLGPDGAKHALVPVYTRDLAVLDVDTKANGTYRISTGLREGSSRKAALVAGQWEFFEGADAPSGAIDMQSFTRADVYVSRGTPDKAALATTGKALEFELLTHPNQLFAGSGLKLRVLHEGRPLAKQVVTLNATNGASSDAPAQVELRSSGDGVVEVPLPQAGVFHVMTRHRLGPTAGSTGRSYTIALTIEVTE